MAARLKAACTKIDAFVCSPAKRAKKTAELFTTEFKYPEADIIEISALYHASAETFFETVIKLPETAGSVALFSHNPGITHFVNELLADVRIDNMPTCGLFALEFDGQWPEFEKAKKNFLFFDYPKRIV